MKKVTIFDHPLIQHKTTILRQTTTSNKEFRESVEEITMLMCYEALRDLPLEEIEIETPITKTRQKVISGKHFAVVIIFIMLLPHIAIFLLFFAAALTICCTL